MTPDRTTDEYATAFPLPEGSRWLHFWTEPVPNTDLVALNIQVEIVAVRLSNIAWVLLTPTEARKVLGLFSQIADCVLREGVVYVPLDEWGVIHPGQEKGA